MNTGVILLIVFGALLIIGGPIFAERASKAASKAQQSAEEAKNGAKTSDRK